MPYGYLDWYAAHVFVVYWCNENDFLNCKNAANIPLQLTNKTESERNKDREKVGRFNTTPQNLSKTTATKTLAARPKISLQPHHIQTTQPVTALLTADPGSTLFLMSGAGKPL